MVLAASATATAAASVAAAAAAAVAAAVAAAAAAATAAAAVTATAAGSRAMVESAVRHKVFVGLRREGEEDPEDESWKEESIFHKTHVQKNARACTYLQKHRKRERSRVKARRSRILMRL